MQSMVVEQAKKRIEEINIDLVKAQADHTQLMIQHILMVVVSMALLVLAVKSNPWIFVLTGIAFVGQFVKLHQVEMKANYIRARKAERIGLEHGIEFGKAMVEEYRNAPIKPE